MSINAEYALQAVKGIKEDFDNSAKDSLDMYKDNQIFDFYTTDEVFEIYTSTESMNGFKELTNSETPPILNLEEGYSVTIEEKRFGGAIVLDETTYRRNGIDSTMKVDSYLAKQAAGILRAATKKFLDEAFLMLNDGFTGTYYTAPDAAALFATHTWNTGGTFANNVTAVLDEAGTAVDTAWEYAGAFKDAAGIESPLNWTHIIVKKGSAAARTAKKLFAESISPVAVGDINIYQGELTVVETPFITTANKLNWYLRDSSIDNCLKVGIGEYPTMREGIRLENEGVRTNVTGFWKQGIVNMPFGWYGSTGAA
ncbi:hypothetical protein HGB13_00180 [bacterium]|nr:hypothetical protein [bacterium]